MTEYHGHIVHGKPEVLTQPGEVDGDLLAEVLPDVVERLVLLPLAPARPVLQGRNSTLTKSRRLNLVLTKYNQIC